MSLGIYAWQYLTDKRCFSVYIQVAESVDAIRSRIIMKTVRNDRWTEITCNYAVCPVPSNQYTKLFFTRPDGTEITYRSLEDLVLHELPNVRGDHLFNGILVTAHDN